MTPSETAAQLRLAADILETGHPWEYQPDYYTWVLSQGRCPIFCISQKWPIRLALSAPWPEQPKSAELTPELATKGYEQYGFGPGITVVEQPKPFTLPTPPPGMRWHREDGWTAEMLPPGTRPLVMGEKTSADDEYNHTGSGKFKKVAEIGRTAQVINDDFWHHRTTRPLTFTHEDHKWTWHRAGDPRPVPGNAMVHILVRGGDFTGNESPAKARDYTWETLQEYGAQNCEIIGWRYADAEKPDLYAELKKAHAEGKVIQGCIRGHWIDCPHPTWKYPLDTYRIKPDEIPWIEHDGGPCPLKDEEVEEFEFKTHTGTSGALESPSVWRWSLDGNKGDIIAYRVLKWREKKPKVPLGPEDVPPGSVFRYKESDDPTSWQTPLELKRIAICFHNGNNGVIWKSWEVMQNYQINRSIPLTGKWNPDAWEPCHKEINA